MIAPGDRKLPRQLAGIVLVDKPQGLTSNRILQKTKRLFQARKAGHTGTLDPMATGMLPICFGAATKVSGMMLESSKRYRVTARFGSATDTGDATGTVIDRDAGPAVPIDVLRAAVDRMVGPIRQIPPMYSALKHEGKRLYELARAGKEVPRKAREVEIFELTIESFEWPDLTLQVHCSKGTYVRSLVVDLAQAVGTVAHVAALRRLSVGPFAESQMVGFDELETAASEGLESLDRLLLDADAALVDRPAVRVSEADGVALRQGRRVALVSPESEGSVRIYDAEGRFVGIGDVDRTGAVRPARIFPA
jgi:tRNA pseudouridine55 synthase